MPSSRCATQTASWRDCCVTTGEGCADRCLHCYEGVVPHVSDALESLSQEYPENMEADEIGRIIEASRRSLSEGRGLKGTRFWRAVGAVRADSSLVDRWAADIGAIDREAFEKEVRLRVRAFVGTAVLSAGTIAAIAVLYLAKRADGEVLRILLFFGAFGALLITTHSLAHWVTGRLLGMKFIYYFLGGPSPPRPGAKVDYATYLRVPPAKRAIMHASGAVVTKVLPFALIPVALALNLPSWCIAVLAVVGVVQIITDVLFSTKTSDWKKVKREWNAARQ